MPTIGSILGEAFGLVRTRFAAVAAWAGLYFVATFGMGLMMRPLMAAQAQDFARLQAGGPPAPFAAFGTLGPAFLLVELLLLAVMLALYAAAFRAILFPARGRAFYLRLGMDELRLLGLMIVLGIAGVVLWIVAALAFAALAAGLAMLLGVNSGGGSGAFAGVILLVVLLFFPLAGGFIFLWTRISLAGPLTLLRRRIVIGEAWRLSRGHFWTLFGVYLLLGIALLVAFMVVAAIFGGIDLPRHDAGARQSGGTPADHGRAADDGVRGDRYRGRGGDGAARRTVDRACRRRNGERDPPAPAGRHGRRVRLTR